MGDFDNQLRRLQLTMLEMLKMVDKICRENDIQYSLSAGTLLGAVRHKGFIPWDDDLDIRMTRENYDKFLAVWDKLRPEGYLIQNKENSPNFPSSFSKIRKRNTTFLQFESERGAHHTGIFIDIFPFDRMPQSRLKKLSFIISCLKYQIYTRDKENFNANQLRNICASFINRITTVKYRQRYRENFIQKLREINKDESLPFVAIEVPSLLKIKFPNDLDKEYTQLQFENEKFYCFKKWDEALRLRYCDYMKLPPEEERVWKHHPIILDFEHGLDENN